MASAKALRQEQAFCDPGKARCEASRRNGWRMAKARFRKSRRTNSKGLSTVCTSQLVAKLASADQNQSLSYSLPLQKCPGHLLGEIQPFHVD